MNPMIFFFSTLLITLGVFGIDAYQKRKQYLTKR